MGAVVVVTHLPDEGHFRSERHQVRPVRCDDDFDYWRGLARVWNSDLTIVNVEHDIDVTDWHIDELLACPESCCSWAYTCHWVSTGQPRPVIAAGAGDRDAINHPPPEAYYLQGGEQCAAWSAIGLIKLAPEARVAPLRREPWSRLELAVHDAVTRPWHMHWPLVTHHHW